MTGSNAYRWSRRTTTGGNTSNNNYGTGTAPNTRVRLVRTGSTCYIGLAVGSGSDTTLNTSQFSNVRVTP
jgi:hypothetical protein